MTVDYRRFILLVCALWSLLTGCSSFVAPRPHRLMPSAGNVAAAVPPGIELPRELEKQVLPDYRVGPGDVLLIEANDFDSEVRLPADQTVRSDGTIELGQYGRLQVAGMTTEEIQADVEQRISEREGKDESFHVRLMELENQVYYVVGEVKSAASFPIVGRETVLDAIMAAGGLTDRADRHSLILSRPTDCFDSYVVLPICYRHIVQMGDSSTNYQIMPGDRIYVPSLTLTQQLLGGLFHGGHRCPRCASPRETCAAEF